MPAQTDRQAGRNKHCRTFAKKKREQQSTVHKKKHRSAGACAAKNAVLIERMAASRCKLVEQRHITLDHMHPGVSTHPREARACLSGTPFCLARLHNAEDGDPVGAAQLLRDAVAMVGGVHGRQIGVQRQASSRRSTGCDRVVPRTTGTCFSPEEIQIECIKFKFTEEFKECTRWICADISPVLLVRSAVWFSLKVGSWGVTIPKGLPATEIPTPSALGAPACH